MLGLECYKRTEQVVTIDNAAVPVTNLNYSYCGKSKVKRKCSIQLFLPLSTSMNLSLRSCFSFLQS